MSTVIEKIFKEALNKVVVPTGGQFSKEQAEIWPFGTAGSVLVSLGLSYCVVWFLQRLTFHCPVWGIKA